MIAVHVTTPYLLEAANSCDKTAGDLDTVLADIRNFVVQLEETWKGIAPLQFANLMDTYDRSGRNLHEALLGIAQNLRINAGNYGDTEYTNSDLFVQAGGGFPGANLLVEGRGVMPDADGVTLNVPIDLQAAGATLIGKATAAVDELARLKTQLAPVLEDWQSPAALQYAPYQAEWNAAADNLFGPDGVLGQIASALNIAWNNYTDCEWANVKGWQRT